MRKCLIILICVLFMFLVVGCVQNKSEETTFDERDTAVMKLIRDRKYDEALEKVNEVFEGNEDKKSEYLDTIYKGLNIERQKQELYEKMRPSPKLEIQSGYKYEIRGDYVYIIGRVKNVNDKDIRYFEVRIDFKDSDGKILHTDYTNDGLTLKPNAMREFEIMSKWNDEYQKYSLSIGDVK